MRNKHTDFAAFVGDSRVRFALSAKEFDRLAAGHSLTALKLSVSASKLRDWYYWLKHIDPGCNAFKYVIIVLPSYWDEDYPEYLSDDLTDVYILLPILTFADEIDLVGSFNDAQVRLEALLSYFVKMYGYRTDLATFISDPVKRLNDCAYWQPNGQRSDYEYESEMRSVVGVRVFDGRLIVPDGLLKAHQERALRREIFRQAVSPDFNSNYMRFWLNRIVNRYSKSRTKIVFVHIPHFVLPDQTKQPHIRRTIDYLSHFSNVIIEPEDEFEFLRQPKYFLDATHLNREGNRLFTNSLSARILDLDQAER